MSFTTQLPAAQEYVYVIHATGTNRIKLGYTTNPQGRLAALQNAAGQFRLKSQSQTWLALYYLQKQ